MVELQVRDSSSFWLISLGQADHEGTISLKTGDRRLAVADLSVVVRMSDGLPRWADDFGFFAIFHQEVFLPGPGIRLYLSRTGHQLIVV